MLTVCSIIVDSIIIYVDYLVDWYNLLAVRGTDESSGSYLTNGDVQPVSQTSIEFQSVILKDTTEQISGIFNIDVGRLLGAEEDKGFIIIKALSDSNISNGVKFRIKIDSYGVMFASAGSKIDSTPSRSGIIATITKIDDLTMEVIIP